MNTRASLARDDGFSLPEVLVAMLVLVSGVLALAQLFVLATRSTLASRDVTYATILAEQKMEQLRSLTWGFDSDGDPLSDTTTDTATPFASAGGTGLSPSPGNALHQNTAGYVDHIDSFGVSLGGGQTSPAGALYTRRWSIASLPADPEALLIQVAVTRHDRPEPTGWRRRQDEARLITVRRRTAR